MKSRFIPFAVVVTSCALGGYAGPPRINLPAVAIEFPPVRIATPVGAEFAIPVRPGPPLQTYQPFVCGCMLGGGFRIPGIPDARRETMLTDAVAAIGAAYLKSRSVKVALLDPGVHVDTYPEGRFGNWVQNGVLVTERREFTDEPEIRQVFVLLVEALGERELDLFLGDGSNSSLSVSDYRRDTGFVAEVSVEFVGEAPLRVELNLQQERLLIEAGGRWEVYALDQWSGAALRRLLAAPDAKMNVTY
jgi:hypothetical protein